MKVGVARIDVRPSAWRIAIVSIAAIAAVLVVAFAAWIAVHGRVDFTFNSRHHAIRRVTPVSLAAWLLLLGAGAALGPAARAFVIDRCSAWLRRHATAAAAVVAIAVCAAAAGRGGFTAAGADPYGYVSQSLLWAEGNPVQILPRLARDAPVDESAFCPLGYRPGAVEGTMAPSYAPGFPLQMAILIRAIGPRAGYWVVPLLAGLAVWFTYAIARRFTRPAMALVAAACAACSPVFVFQMLQPMSDVPVTAWWLAAVAFGLQGTRTSAFAAGLAASLAILTRPNIVPLVAPVALFLPARRQISWFLAGCVPGLVLVAAVNHVFYGSATTSGYGSISDIYHASGALQTGWQYLVWLWDTHSVLILMPVLLPVIAFARPNAVTREDLRFGWCVLAFFVTLLACYAPYMRFDHWTYLRFLLPAIPLVLIVTFIVLQAVVANASGTARALVLAFVTLMFPFAFVHTAAKGDAFALKPGFQRIFEGAAAFAADRLPPNAVFLALTQSGSLRHYAGRMTLRYQNVDPARADALLQYLKQRGLAPYAALDAREVRDFDDRFRGTSMERSRASATPLPLPPDGVVLFYPLEPGSR
ncbi:MAG TPA: glycosyltransferase family 39 protein [Vicinamibacterales bacterium]|nr:glycosyltransferase family 39 protein [Vicinamibacterales bacterium]